MVDQVVFVTTILVTCCHKISANQSSAFAGVDQSESRDEKAGGDRIIDDSIANDHMIHNFSLKHYICQYQYTTVRECDKKHADHQKDRDRHF